MMQIKILVIDDDPIFLEMLRDFWEKKENCKIETTKNPKKSLELVENNDYNVIVSDYQMPVMNGLELLKKIRGRDEKLPFVLITGKGNEEVAKKALNQKVDGYITKEEDPEEQYETVMNAIYENTI